MAVHELTIGRSGSGKTAFEVHQLVTQWLPFPHNRNFFTNLPLKLDAIADYLVQHHPELVSAAALARIKLFDAAVTDAWMEEKSGPWDYFAQADMDGGKIVIDEIHNFIHTKSTQAYIQKWRKWLGEIRHCGCTFEAISQYETKIHPLIRHEAGLIRRLANSEDKRDKVLWVKWHDHFQILSKIRGFYSSRVWVDEYSEEAGKWTRTGGGSVPLIPLYYNLYNSYSAPIAGGGKGAVLSPHPYARMRWPELLSWYVARNGFRIVLALMTYAVFAWLFVFGGIPKILDGVTRQVAAKTAAAKPADKTADKATAASDSAPAPPPRLAITHPAIWTRSGVYDAAGHPWTPPDKPYVPLVPNSPAYHPPARVPSRPPGGSAP